MTNNKITKSFYKINNETENNVNILNKKISKVDILYDSNNDLNNYMYDFINLPQDKIFYPEPYIASPSFHHEDLWFIHILHYQYWLWFFFISLIWLFFITFLSVIHNCNPRNMPKRETRGVSRSKCADLITACVPVTWALTIIISESVDAADYYDGFGTGEIIIGIRAYQWGWEYFFPKSIDLNYDVSSTYSSITGNSIKYNKSSLTKSTSNTFWKSMKSNINIQNSSIPTNSIISPSDNNKIMDFIDYNKVGSSTIKVSNAFRKIQFSTKTNSRDIFNRESNFSIKYNNINNLFSNDTNSQDSLYYGIKRQHEYSSTKSITNNLSSQLDNKSVSKLLDYNSNFILTNDKKRNLLDKLYNTSKDIDNNTANSFGSKSIIKNLDAVNTNIVSKPNSKKFLDKKTLSTPSNNYLNSENLYINSNNYDIYMTSDTSSDIFYKKFVPKTKVQKFNDEDKHSRNLKSFRANEVNFNISGDNEKFIYKANNVNSKGHMPFSFLNSRIPSVSFDIFKNNEKPDILKTKADLSPNFIFGSFWSTTWSNSDSSLRLFNMNKYNNVLKNNSSPSIIEYDEYNFRNWQYLELVDDFFWESTFSNFSQEEYNNSLIKYSNDYKFKKKEKWYNLLNRNKKSIYRKKFSPAYQPFFRDYVNTTSISSVPSYIDDFYIEPSLISIKNFNIFDNEYSLDSIEESYENSKFNNYINYQNFLNSISMSYNNLLPISYIVVLNEFRSNPTEAIQSFDNLGSNLKTSNEINIIENSDSRYSNYLKLRSPSKNFITTFNALHKVFRPRFDDGRSNMRFQDLSNTYVRYPFLSEGRVKYESLLGKNKNNFFNAVGYKNFISNNFSSIHSQINSLNTYFANIPFLMSLKSDASRYLWFDWQSRWNSIEVQPSSVAKYSLVGVPYFTKNFEYETSQSEIMKDSENYATRLLKARKNYMSSWALTPYIYNRVSNWYYLNGNLSNISNVNDVYNLKISLKFFDNSWNNSYYMYPSIQEYSPTINDINAPARAYWRPQEGTQSYAYTMNILSSILSKREYLIREYLMNRSSSVVLPNTYRATPSNSLYEDIKKSFNLYDITSYISESQRDFFYENTNSFRLSFLNNLFNNNLSFLNTSWVNNILYYSTLNNNLNDNLGNNNLIYKNQFRPMRKGISSMIRLHATGAIAMPNEMRLHILASSRDIIHSWAIPSAGIKIDCVPGYSSHRIAIFFSSGIFWGQCMEICGRFHHWMPIIVYFMKRDLFFLWCTHFIHFNPSESSFNMDSKEFSSKIRKVSFSNNWIY